MPTKDARGTGNRLFRLIGFGISVVLCLAALAWYILSRPEIGRLGGTGLLEIFEAKTLDLRFRLRGVRNPGNEIVIIVMDEQTENALGRWQSAGRRWLAKLLAVLQEGRAKVIGFDLALAEPDEGSAPEAIAALKARYVERIDPTAAGYAAMLREFDATAAAHDYDRQLAEAIRSAGNVVLGYYLFDAPDSPQLTPEQQAAQRLLLNRVKYTLVKFPAGEAQPPLRLRRVAGVKPNLPLFADAAWSFGHFSVPSDRDSYILRAPLLIDYLGDYYPSLTLEIARAYLKPLLPPIIHAQGKATGGNIELIQLGTLAIPTNEKGELFLNYYGPARTFPYYALADVVLGKIPPAEFAGKIVLFGFTGTVYQDVHSTPFQADTYPGVEIQATIIANMLRQDFLTRPEAAMLLDALMLLLCGIVLGIALPLIRPLRGAIVAGLCLLVTASVAYLAFRFGNLWLNCTFPGLFITGAYLTLTSYNLAITTYQYFTAEKKKRELKQAFQHYVSPAVVDQILSTPEKLELGGEERILTAFFSDIRGFTTLSEGMSPKNLVNFLNEFFTAMTDIILAHGGTLDKYIGDAIMVFYGAPLAQPDHAAQACQTAIDMLLCLQELRVRWTARGLPEINLGIGINSGEMVVGNIGSPTRFNYTIMGDAVNLASRLEGINKEYGTNIVISQATYDLIRNDAFLVRELDCVCVKGKQQPITIYELLGYGTLYEQRKPVIAVFSEGLTAYKHRQWRQAMAYFQNVLQLAPQDQPAQMYLKRCTAYLEHPPPDDWDGVFVMKTK